jgi:hypothetical protein
MSSGARWRRDALNTMPQVAVSRYRPELTAAQQECHPLKQFHAHPGRRDLPRPGLYRGPGRRLYIVLVLVGRLIITRVFPRLPVLHLQNPYFIFQVNPAKEQERKLPLGKQRP